MVSKGSEDPMDLGPFLQNYVLRNPFHELARASTKLTNVSFKSTRNRIPGPDRRKLKRKYSARLAPVLPKEGRQLSSTPSAGSLKKESWTSDDDCDGYDQIKIWLQDNFRHVPGYQICSVSSTSVLCNVKESFPSITFSTLGELVMTTFPGCVLINKKNGIFYQGLVAKPEANVLENTSPNMKMALDKITKGSISIEQASKTYHIKKAAIISAVAWGNYKLSSGLPLTSNPKHDDKFDDNLEITMKAKSKPQVDGPNIGRIPGNYQSACKNSRLELEDDGDSLDFELMLQDDEDDLRKNTTSEISFDIKVCKQEIEKDYLNSTSSDNFQVVGSAIKAEPSSEEYASDDIQNTDSLNEKKSRTTYHNHNHASNETILKTTHMIGRHDCSPSQTFPHTSSQIERRLGEFPTLRNQLDGKWRETRDNLDRCERTNVRLQTELNAVNDENLLLQDELNKRDFQLANLAEDFFELHNQFKRLAQKFQQVLDKNQTVNGGNGIS